MSSWRVSSHVHYVYMSAVGFVFLLNCHAKYQLFFCYILCLVI